MSKRIGYISAIDLRAELATITDSNDQDIDCRISTLDFHISLGQRVWFEITLTKYGLEASNLNTFAENDMIGEN
ncbi:MAG: hypothetical protein EOO20_26795 [Chryseobacterium sp.]|nr:MAG: hypothetical protein EOO20_26795 [Chryseobacterium sp.]